MNLAPTICLESHVHDDTIPRVHSHTYSAAELTIGSDEMWIDGLYVKFTPIEVQKKTRTHDAMGYYKPGLYCKHAIDDGQFISFYTGDMRSVNQKPVINKDSKCSVTVCINGLMVKIVPPDDDRFGNTNFLLHPAAAANEPHKGDANAFVESGSHKGYIYAALYTWTPIPANTEIVWDHNREYKDMLDTKMKEEQVYTRINDLLRMPESKDCLYKIP